jgi:hypothetical protein
MMTDFRALCAELVNELQDRKDHDGCYSWPEDDPEQDLIERARAALADEVAREEPPYEETRRRFLCNQIWQW